MATRIIIMLGMTSPYWINEAAFSPSVPFCSHSLSLSVVSHLSVSSSCRDSWLPEPRHWPLSQPAEVQPPLPPGRVWDWVLPPKPQAIFWISQGAVPCPVQGLSSLLLYEFGYLPHIYKSAVNFLFLWASPDSLALGWCVLYSGARQLYQMMWWTLLASLPFSLLCMQPTLSHYFIRLLAEKGLLLRNFTQVRLLSILQCTQLSVLLMLADKL